MKQKIIDSLKKLQNNQALFYIFPDENYPELRSFLLKKIMKKSKKSGIYINLNKPYKFLIDDLKSQDIKKEELFFIDCTSKKIDNEKNTVFIESLSALTSIGIALDPFFKNKNAAFIFIDSLDSLITANSEETIIRFIRFLIERARDNEMNVVMISLSGTVHKILSNEISVLCDNIVYVRK